MLPDAGHTGPVNPVSTVLFLLGYGLALPVMARVRDVVDQQHGLALAGHQVGMALVAAGWLFRGGALMAAIHIAWAVGLKVWFSVAGRRGS